MQEVAGECSPLPPISRVRRSVEEARRAYDRMSAWYDLFGGFGERRCIELGLDLLGVRTGERVLEVGCGTGSALVPLARSAGKSGKVYGLDLSSGMAHRTRERLDRASLGGRVPLILGDGATLPLADDALDAVFVSFTLELFDTPRIPLALAECRRVLNANVPCLLSAWPREGRTASRCASMSGCIEHCRATWTAGRFRWTGC